jgi:hypothetical protein
MSTISLPTDVRCVGLVMAALPDSTLSAASSGINTVIQTLTAYEVILQARLLSLGFIMVPLQAKKIAAENVLQAYQSTINVFAQGAINQCPALGTTTQVIKESVNPYISTAKNLLNIINITARLQMEYGEYRNTIVRQINFLRQVKAQIDNVIQIRTGVVLTAAINPSVR